MVNCEEEEEVFHEEKKNSLEAQSFGIDLRAKKTTNPAAGQQRNKLMMHK